MADEDPIVTPPKQDVPENPGFSLSPEQVENAKTWGTTRNDIIKLIRGHEKGALSTNPHIRAENLAKIAIFKKRLRDMKNPAGTPGGKRQRKTRKTKKTRKTRKTRKAH